MNKKRSASEVATWKGWRFDTFISAFALLLIMGLLVISGLRNGAEIGAFFIALAVFLYTAVRFVVIVLFISRG